MSNAENNIKARVDSFVNDLSDLIRQSALEAVAEALKKGGEVTVAAPAARRPSRPAKVVEAPPLPSPLASLVVRPRLPRPLLRPPLPSAAPARSARLFSSPR